MVGFLRRHRVALASSVVLLVAAASLVAYALSSQGYPVRHVELNDGGIWVTSDKDGLFGRLNKPAAALDAGFYPPGATSPDGSKLEIAQDSSAVAAWDRSSGTLYPVDVSVRKALKDGSVPVASTDQVAMAGGTVAVLDPATGKVWATHEDPSTSLTDLTALDATGKPVGTVGTAPSAEAGASLAVGVDGTIHVVSAGGTLISIAPTESGFATPVRSTAALTASTPLQLTAVGGNVVVLDPASGRIALPDGHSATIPADKAAVIQRPSPGRRDVVVATATSLLSVPIDGGTATTLFRGVAGTGTIAAPTWLGPCVHSAWSGNPGTYVKSCNGAAATAGNLGADAQLTSPVFRVNRNAIALNDTQSGKVWDVDDTPRRVDNWQSVTPPPTDQRSDKDKNDNNSAATQDLPPKAADDIWGARPGRTTVLHVLDNDSDPQGYILSVQSVTAPDDPSATLSIAPDGQTVEIAMPGNGSDVHFSYTIDDGKGLTATANVTVQSRPVGQNTPPQLRVGYTPPTFAVAAGGRLSIPALADWRDFDGDPLFLHDVATGGSGTASSSPDGRIDLVAPATAATVTMTYDVDDGFAPSQGTSTVSVLDPASTSTTPPTAEPDVARGQVGQPIVIHPLDNDLPGADPTTPAAVLALAGAVASPAGSTVVTDTKAGTVTVTAARAGVFLLSYSAAYGNAAFATGAIRVDVIAPPATPLPPVAMPDTGVLFGQNPAIVDVLANDFDPAGAVLVVDHAEPASSSDQVSVAILSGHWLRIAALSATSSTAPILVRYTVRDGIAAAATGEVTLTAQPQPASDTPVTRDDTAVVRAGDSVAIPVLDNDTSPAGSPLSLTPVVAGLDKVPGFEKSAAGQLKVTTVDGKPDGIGAAYVSGNLVRYVPPAAVAVPTTALIEYVAQNPTGETAIGHVRVTVNPLPGTTNPNQPPVPEPLVARVVAGDTVHVNVPATGVDPDGDSVSVTGITVPIGSSAATLGRITKTSATTIDYQSFPSSTTGGTDTFTYRVTDRFGGTGDATVRVAVVQPGDPQPPVAVDDVVTAAPGVTLTADVLANDLRTTDDAVKIADLTDTNPDLPGGVSLQSGSGPIKLTTPAADGKPMVVLYSISDGIGTPSVGKLTVRSVADYNNPPFAVDAYAQPADKATTVTVDVLAKDGDVDGDPSRLEVAATGQQVSAGKVTIKVTSQPQTLPYTITDAGGAMAAAVIHVPASGIGAPFVKDGQLIKVDQNKSVTFDVDKYVTDPAGKPLILTLKDRVWAAPAAGLKVDVVDGKQMTVTGLADYVGPAAVTFEVTDGTTVDDPKGTTAVVTVPVQVGPETPVLRCPGSSLTVIEGGNDLGLDITSLCHVWVANQATLGSLTYKVAFTAAVDSVSVVASGTHAPSVRAGGAAKPGASGTLTVTVDGFTVVPGTIAVTVAAAPTPRIAPITIDGFKAGDAANLDLAGYVTSQLRDPVITVVSIARSEGMPATATSSGSKVSIKPGADSHGVIAFAVVVSDVASTNRPDRQVTGRIVLNVLNVPDAPGAPVPDRSVISHVVQLSWVAPAANGAPIDYYTVSWGGGSQQCPASPCAIANLTNGQQYTFTLTAHNLVGNSKPSGSSPAATPDEVPGVVPGIVATAVGGAATATSSVMLTWVNPPNEGSALTGIQVSGVGLGVRSLPADARQTVFDGLTNGVTYTFEVRAGNSTPGTWGPWSSDVGATPFGVPFQLIPPTATNSESAVPSDKQTISVAVHSTPTEGNGRDITSYTVLQMPGGATQTVSAPDTTAAFQVANDGTSYKYTATATNSEGKESAGSDPSEPVVAAGVPDQAPTPTLTTHGDDSSLYVSWSAGQVNGGIVASVTFTLSNGTSSTETSPANPYTIAGSHWNLTNGQSYTVHISVCNERDKCGAASNESGLAQPYGPPPAPDAHATNNGTVVTYTWSGQTNGRPLSHIYVSIDGGGYQDMGPNGGSMSPDRGYSYNYSISAYSVDDSGNRGDSAAQTGSTPPAPTVQLYQGTKCSPDCGSPGSNRCTSSSCAYLHVVLANFPGTVTCSFDGGGAPGQNFPDASGLSPSANQDVADFFGYPNYTIGATCTSGTASASASYKWPNN